MPNWCGNYLEIEGPAEDIDTLVDLVCAHERGFLSAFYPPPPGREEYDWCVANWGTKWDIGVPFSKTTAAARENPDLLPVTFDSAWSPPLDALKMISHLCPRLRFRLCYEEGGCDFAGMAEYQAGECINSEETGAMPTQIPARSGNSDDEEDTEWVDNPDYVGIESRWEDGYSDAPLTRTAEELAEADAVLKEELPTAQSIQVCKHCRHLEPVHANGQCLFGSTYYDPGGPMVRVIQWLDTPPDTENDSLWAARKERITRRVDEGIDGITTRSADRSDELRGQDHPGYDEEPA